MINSGAVIGKICAKENDGKAWELSVPFKCANDQFARQPLVTQILCVQKQCSQKRQLESDLVSLTPQTYTQYTISNTSLSLDGLSVYQTSLPNAILQKLGWVGFKI